MRCAATSETISGRCRPLPAHQFPNHPVSIFTPEQLVGIVRHGKPSMAPIPAHHLSAAVARTGPRLRDRAASNRFGSPDAVAVYTRALLRHISTHRDKGTKRKTNCHTHNQRKTTTSATLRARESPWFLRNALLANLPPLAQKKKTRIEISKAAHTHRHKNKTGSSAEAGSQQRKAGSLGGLRPRFLGEKFIEEKPTEK